MKKYRVLSIILAIVLLMTSVRTNWWERADALTAQETSAVTEASAASKALTLAAPSTDAEQSSADIEGSEQGADADQNADAPDSTLTIEAVTDGEKTTDAEPSQQEETVKTQNSAQTDGETASSSTGENIYTSSPEESTESSSSPKDADSSPESEDPTEEAALAWQTLTIEAEPAELQDEQNNPTEPVTWMNNLWQWLFARDAETETFTDSKWKLFRRNQPDPVILTISGYLPEGVTAEASYIQFAEPDIYSETALLDFDLALYDAEGNPYIPETDKPFAIQIDGRIINAAAEAEKDFLVYARTEDTRDEKTLKELLKDQPEDTFTASMLVYRASIDEDAYRNYTTEPTQAEESYVLFSEVKYTDIGQQKSDQPVQFAKDDEKKGTLTTQEDKQISVIFEAGTLPLRFVLSAQQAERSLETTTEDGQTEVSVQGALSENMTVEAETIEKADDTVENTAQNTAQDAADNSAGNNAEATVADAVDGELVGAWEISLNHKEEGACQPDAPVTVTITDDAIGSVVEEGADLTVWSISDEGEAVQVEGAAFHDNTVEFETESLATFAVTYTVDFHFGDGEYDFSIRGGNTISVKNLITRLHIADAENVDVETFVGNIENVEFSNPEVATVAKVENETTVENLLAELGLDPQFTDEMTYEEIEKALSEVLMPPDWAFISTKPFDTQETLTITLKNGDVITIDVTDAMVTRNTTIKNPTVNIKTAGVTQSFASNLNFTLKPATATVPAQAVVAAKNSNTVGTKYYVPDKIVYSDYEYQVTDVSALSAQAISGRYLIFDDDLVLHMLEAAPLSYLAPVIDSMDNVLTDEEKAELANFKQGNKNSDTDNIYELFKNASYDENENTVTIILKYFQKMKRDVPLDFIFIYDDSGTMSSAATNKAKVNGVEYSFKASQSVWCRIVLQSILQIIMEWDNNDADTAATEGGYASGVKSKHYDIRVAPIGFASKAEPGTFQSTYAEAKEEISHIYSSTAGTDHRYAIIEMQKLADESIKAKRNPIVVYLSDFHSNANSTAAKNAMKEFRTLKSNGEPVPVYTVHMFENALRYDRNIASANDKMYLVKDTEPIGNLLGVFDTITKDAIGYFVNRNLSVQDAIAPDLVKVAESYTVSGDGQTAKTGDTYGWTFTDNDDNRMQAGKLYTKTITIKLKDDAVISPSMASNASAKVVRSNEDENGNKTGSTELNSISTQPQPKTTLRMVLGLLDENGGKTNSVITGAKFELYKNGSKVWEGTTATSTTDTINAGEISIPYDNAAFEPGDVYTLKQIDTNTAIAMLPTPAEWTMTVNSNHTITSTCDAKTPSLTIANGKFHIWNEAKANTMTALVPVIVKKEWNGYTPSSDDVVKFTVLGNDGNGGTVELPAYTSNDRTAANFEDTQVTELKATDNYNGAWSKLVYVPATSGEGTAKFTFFDTSTNAYTNGYTIREDDMTVTVKDPDDGGWVTTVDNTGRASGESYTYYTYEGQLGSQTISTSTGAKTYRLFMNDNSTVTNNNKSVIRVEVELTYSEGGTDNIKATLVLNYNNAQDFHVNSYLEQIKFPSTWSNIVPEKIYFTDLGSTQKREISFTTSGVHGKYTFYQVKFEESNVGSHHVVDSQSLQSEGRIKRIPHTATTLAKQIVKLTNTFTPSYNLAFTSTWADGSVDRASTDNIASVTYAITDSSGKVYGEPVTVAKGETGMVKVPAGTYTVSQQSYTLANGTVVSAANGLFDAFTTDAASKSASFSGTGGTTQTITFTNTRKRFDVTVKAVWNPDDSQYKQTEYGDLLTTLDYNVTYTKCVADGADYKVQTETLSGTVEKSKSWTDTKKDIPVYGIDGTKTVCDATPDALDTLALYYTTETSAEQNGDNYVFTIVNTVKTALVTINKEWAVVDADFNNETMPASVTVTVKKDKSPFYPYVYQQDDAGNTVLTRMDSAEIVITAENDWHASVFLPVGGNYYFEETQIGTGDTSKYTVSYSGQYLYNLQPEGAEITVTNFLNPAPVKVKWVVKNSDGSFSPLNATKYPDGIFPLSADAFRFDAQGMYTAIGKSKMIVEDRYYFRYYGLGASTAVNENELNKSNLSDFYLKNDTDGIHYSSKQNDSGNGELLSGMDTIFIIYSSEPPEGSTYLDVVNNTSFPYMFWNTFIGDSDNPQNNMYSDSAVMIEEGGTLKMFNGNNNVVSAKNTIHLVLLNSAGKYFNLDGGFQNVEYTDVVMATISGTSGEIKLENGAGLYGTKGYVKGILAGEGEKRIVTFNGKAAPDTMQLTIRKEWKENGNDVLASDLANASAAFKIHQMKSTSGSSESGSGTGSSASDSWTEVTTYNNTVTITSADTDWTTVVDSLPTEDESGNRLGYWIEEVSAPINNDQYVDGDSTAYTNNGSETAPLTESKTITVTNTLDKKAESYLPLRINKVWNYDDDVPTKNITEISYTIRGIFADGTTEPVTAHVSKDLDSAADSGKLTGSAANTSWNKTVYVPGGNGAKVYVDYEIEETVNAPDLAVTQTYDKEIVALEGEDSWHSVPAEGWEEGYIRLSSNSSRGSWYTNITNAAFVFIDENEAAYRSTVSFAADRNFFENSQEGTFYVKLRLPKDVDYNSFTLVGTDSQKVVQFDDGVEYYGISMTSSVEKDGHTLLLPGFSMNDENVADRAFGNVKFIKASELPSDAIVFDGNKKLEAYGNTNITITNEVSMPGLVPVVVEKVWDNMGETIPGTFEFIVKGVKEGQRNQELTARASDSWASAEVKSLSSNDTGVTVTTEDGKTIWTRTVYVPGKDRDGEDLYDSFTITEPNLPTSDHGIWVSDVSVVPGTEVELQPDAEGYYEKNSVDLPEEVEAPYKYYYFEFVPLKSGKVETVTLKFRDKVLDKEYKLVFKVPEKSQNFSSTVTYAFKVKWAMNGGSDKFVYQDALLNGQPGTVSKNSLRVWPKQMYITHMFSTISKISYREDPPQPFTTITPTKLQVTNMFVKIDMVPVYVRKVWVAANGDQAALNAQKQGKTISFTVWDSGRQHKLDAYDAESGGNKVTQLTSADANTSLDPNGNIWEKKVWVPAGILQDGRIVDFSGYTVAENTELSDGDAGVWGAVVVDTAGTVPEKRKVPNYVETTADMNTYVRFTMKNTAPSYTFSEVAVGFNYTQNGTQKTGQFRLTLPSAMSTSEFTQQEYVFYGFNSPSIWANRRITHISFDGGETYIYDEDNPADSQLYQPTNSTYTGFFKDEGEHGNKYNSHNTATYTEVNSTSSKIYVQDGWKDEDISVPLLKMTNTFYPDEKAYVYVNMTGMTENREFMDLLGIKYYSNTNWAPVGEINIPGSFLRSKGDAAYTAEPRTKLLNTDEDWRNAFTWLADMSDANLSATKEEQTINGVNLLPKDNIGNLIKQYVNAADKSATDGLFYYPEDDPYLFDRNGGTAGRYHFDLAFHTSTITFVYGNNSVSDGEAKDGNVLSTRTYITNAEIPEPASLTAPDGYSIEGFYTDASFNTKWEPWNTTPKGTITGDMTVYVKLRKASYIMLNNKSSNDYYYSLTVLNSDNTAHPVSGVIKRGSENQDPETAQTTGNYLFRIKAGNAETLYIPGTSGLQYAVRIYKVNADGTLGDLIDFSSENVKLNDAEFMMNNKVVPISNQISGILVEGPAYEIHDSAGNIVGTDGAGNYDKSRTDHSYDTAFNHKDTSGNRDQIRIVCLVDEGFDVTFKKINGSGEALGGATFSIYKDAECSSIRDRNATETSENDGTVTFEKVPTGISYMMENKADATSGTPNGYEETNQKYIVLVGDTALTRPSIPESGSVWATGGVLENITQSDITAQTGTGNNAKKYAIFLIKGRNAVTDPDIAAQGIMNMSSAKRKVILKKAGDGNAPLSGAHFRIFRADLTEVTEGQPTEKQTIDGVETEVLKGYYESGTSGVYFIGNLPHGKYYLVETEAPGGYDGTGGGKNNTGSVFELTVDASGGNDPGAAKTTIDVSDDSKVIEYLRTWVSTQ